MFLAQYFPRNRRMSLSTIIVVENIIISIGMHPNMLPAKETRNLILIQTSFELTAQRQKEASGTRPPQKVPHPTRRPQTALLLRRGHPQLQPALGHDLRPLPLHLRRPLLTVIRQGDSLQTQSPRARPSLLARRPRRLNPKGRIARSITPHVFQIHRGANDFHLPHVKLPGLRDDPPVDHDHGASVVVRPPAVAAPLVGVEVHPAAFPGGVDHEFHSGLELAQFVVRAGSVGEDFDSAEGEGDVRRLGRPEFFAGFAAEGGGVGALEVVEAEGGAALVVFGKKRLPRQQNGLHPTALRRRPVSGEIPPLPVIPIVRQRALGPHQQHPPILANDPAIVPHPPVQHRHAEIAHQIVRRPAREQLGQRLPAVPKGVHFQKVVFAAVAADLQLRPQAVRGAARLGHLARAEDALEVPLEVEGPLVQVAGGEGHEGGGGEGEAQGRGGLGGDGGAGEGVRVGNGGGGGGSAGGEQREGGSAADAAAEAASRRPGGARCRCAWHGVHF
mmetsp:Transcript_13860/g.28526  ORF Transcript_13860/g.28526 Transcript_13860/m.28526 type:complete len:502 (+) Transcript_13860:1428-2933(+)